MHPRRQISASADPSFCILGGCTSSPSRSPAPRSSEGLARKSVARSFGGHYEDLCATTMPIMMLVGVPTMMSLVVLGTHRAGRANHEQYCACHRYRHLDTFLKISRI